MRRTITALFMAAAVSGCMSANHNPQASTSTPATVRASGEGVPLNVPGVTGPWGAPIPMQAPYTATPPTNEWQARHMMSQSVPLDMAQMGPMPARAQMPGMPQPPNGMPMMAPNGMLTPPGVPFGPQMMPPGGMQMPGASMPQGGMPMPGAMPNSPGGYPPGVVAGVGGMPGAMPGGPNCPIGRTQVRFTGPNGMRVAWLVQGQDNKPGYSAPMVETPGRYNFTQASIYRLKLSKIPGAPPGLEVYPTLEVVPVNRKTEAFLAHSAVPLEFTPEDFKEIAEGKYLVKVIYLPDPQYQELAATGTDQIISTRLDPGADPILEAQRRGSILLVVRMGNVDQEAPNTPSLDAPASAPPGGMAMMSPPGLVPPPALAGQMGTGNSLGGSAVPPSLRGGPSLPPSPPATAPQSPMPTNPGIPLPPAAPSIKSSASKVPEVPSIQPAGTLGMLPDLTPRPTASTGPQLPDTGAVLPPMPPTPAGLATQGPGPY